MNTCRTDRGVCLRRIHKNAGSLSAYIEFTDGKVYLVYPVVDGDLFRLALPSTQPGCWFNKALRKRRGYRFKRLDYWPTEFIKPGLSVDFAHRE